MGAHTLDNFMKTMSKKADLSKMYTNHCIRNTVITALDSKRFEAHHITAVPGHKSENTIKSYSTKCSNIKKRQISDALSSVLVRCEMPPPTSKKFKQAQTSTVFVPPAGTNKNNLGNHDILDWVPIDNNSDDFY